MTVSTEVREGRGRVRLGLGGDSFRAHPVMDPRADADVTVDVLLDKLVAGVAATYAAAVPDGLAAYWRLGEASGATAAAEVGPDGTYVGPTLGTAGLLAGDADTAATFDGVDDHVTLPNLGITGPHTVVLWFARGGVPAGVGTNTFHCLIAGVTGISQFPRLMVNAAGTSIRLQVRDGSNTLQTFDETVTALAVGATHMLAYTYDTTDAHIYLDGALVETAPHTTVGMESDVDPARIGGSTTLGTFQANGVIDDPRVYNRVLSAQELADLYTIGTGGTVGGYPYAVTDGLVASWRLDEASGALLDSSGNGHTLTVSGAPDYGQPSLLLAEPGNDALGFDGAADYASRADAALRPTAGVSFCAWIATTDVDAVTYIGGCGDTGFNGYVLYTQTTGQLVGRIGKGDGATAAVVNSTGQSVNDGAPRFVVLTHDGITARIYVDGVARGATAAPYPIGYGAVTAFRLGQLDTVQAGRYFSGVMDEARVYDRALTAHEVSVLYGTGRGPRLTVPFGARDDRAGSRVEGELVFGPVGGDVRLALYEWTANARTTVDAEADVGFEHDDEETVYRLRWQADGTTFRARVWRPDAEAEPGIWTATGTVTRTAPGDLLLGARANAVVTSAPHVVEFDGLVVQDVDPAAAADVSVADGRGVHHHRGSEAYLQTMLGTTSGLDVDATIAFSLDRVPEGGSALVRFVLRASSDAGYAAGTGYAFEVRVGEDLLTLGGTVLGAGELPEVRLVDREGVQAGTSYHIRASVLGANPTTVRAMLYRDAPPDDWDISTLDSAGPQAAGRLALGSTLLEGVENAPVDVRFDDLQAVVGVATGSASVTGQAGRFTLGAGQDDAWTLEDVATEDLLLGATVSTNAVGSGQRWEQWVRVDAEAGYLARLDSRADGRWEIRVQRVNATGGRSNLAGPVDAGVPVTASAPFRVEVEALTVSAGTTRVRARAWPVDGLPPGSWPVEALDSLAALQGPGAVRVRAASASSRSTPVTYLFDDLSGRPPVEGAVPTRTVRWTVRSEIGFATQVPRTWTIRTAVEYADASSYEQFVIGSRALVEYVPFQESVLRPDQVDDRAQPVDWVTILGPNGNQAGPPIAGGERAMKFNGSDEHVRRPHADYMDVGDGPATWVVWLKRNETGSFVVFDQGPGSIQLGWDGTNGRWRMNVEGVGNGTAFANIPSPDMAGFHQVAVGKHGATRKLWIDGADVTELGTNRIATVSAADAVIGGREDGSAMAGITIAHYHRHNALLTDQEITDDYVAATGSLVARTRSWRVRSGIDTTTNTLVPRTWTLRSTIDVQPAPTQYRTRFWRVRSGIAGTVVDPVPNDEFPTMYAHIVGGDGGTTWEVRTAEEFYDAVQAPGRRRIVGKAPGVWDMRPYATNGSIDVANPFMTIDFREHSIVLYGTDFKLKSDQHKLYSVVNRSGDLIRNQANTTHGLVLNPASDVALVGCEFLWAPDVCFVIRPASGAAIQNVYLDRCIIGEALFRSFHSEANLLDPKNGDTGWDGHGLAANIVGPITNVLIRRTLVTTSQGRNFRVIQAGHVEIVNCAIYNYHEPPKGNPSVAGLHMIGCVWKKGPAPAAAVTTPYSTRYPSGLPYQGELFQFQPSGAFGGSNPIPRSVYIADPLTVGFTRTALIDTASMLSPVPIFTPTVDPAPASTVVSTILQYAGPAVRDATTQRILDDFDDGTGNYVNGYGEWPPTEGPPYPPYPPGEEP